MRNCFIKCRTSQIANSHVTFDKIMQILMRKRDGSKRHTISMARIINNPRGKRLHYKYLMELALDSLLTIPVAHSIVKTR